MSRYSIEVDEDKIRGIIVQILNDCLSDELNCKRSESSNEISTAVKEIVYSRKDEIIDKVVSRATAEIVKKGIPKLMERFGQGMCYMEGETK